MIPVTINEIEKGAVKVTLDSYASPSDPHVDPFNVDCKMPKALDYDLSCLREWVKQCINGTYVLSSCDFREHN